MDCPGVRGALARQPGATRQLSPGESEQRPGGLDIEAIVEFGTRFREAIPDLQFHVDELVAEPDGVATRWTASGTHTEPLLDIEPTGRTVTLSGMRMDTLRNGRLAETWLLTEQWSLLRQLRDTEAATPVPTMGRITATPVVTQLSAPAENEELARAVAGSVWTEGDRAVLDRVLDPDAVLYLDATADLVGHDAFWAFVSRYRDAFPDLRVTIEDIVSEGDKIAVRQRLRGTHEGPIFGVGATGSQVDVGRMVLHHIDDGRIVETGIVEDTLGLLRQLGVRDEVVEPSDTPQ
ncbi:ester cyclase [Halomicroarcula sp. GCM10025709]|uniref:ester cyclase n=1 Tax=Halomicroarcula sp. GCM10025709 TaxID=3252669 RepID=UPI00361FCBB0